MVINTAGPETLSALQTGLLNLLVKDDKGNQLMLENGSWIVSKSYAAQTIH
jgi:hypothetical protein